MVVKKKGLGRGRTALDIVHLYHPEVTSVRDAKKNVSINVTAEDCKQGNAKSPSACAMAKAFCRTYDGAIISIGSAYLIKGKKALRYKTPHSVSREIVSFDRNTNFSPGMYHLAAPAKSMRLGAANHKHYGSGTRGGKKVKERQHYTTDVRAL